VHVVVGFPPGIAPDIIARIIAPWLSERLGQQFVVDNRPGVAGNIGTAFAAKALPDGHTLLMAVSNNAINATLYRNLTFDFTHDFVPVGTIGATTFVMATNPAFPAKTVPEFVAYAKANPGKINMASLGVGSAPHVAGELFKMMTGVDFVHVPYRSNYTPDLLSGQVQLAFPPIAQTSEFVRDGRLHALAVTTSMRSHALPDVPSIGEFLPGYEAAGWYGICVPTGTPDAIIDKLNAEITAAVDDPKIRDRLLTIGVEPRSMTRAAFAKFIADEIEKWAKVIKFAGIKPE
jgi:tripartite-type tricarboxylate transporter receptor subunit TctC